MNESAAIRIVPAKEGDVATILRLIVALAEYEKLAHEVVATEADIRQWLFGPRPVAAVLLAYVGDAVVGFALYFESFSTFVGRPGLFLEDLFVLPQWRRLGIGRRLLLELASEAVRRHCGRLEWNVLNWNASAIAFYERLGARAMTEWTTYRLAGDSLADFAASKPIPGA